MTEDALHVAEDAGSDKTVDSVRGDGAGFERQRAFGNCGALKSRAVRRASSFFVYCSVRRVFEMVAYPSAQQEKSAGEEGRLDEACPISEVSIVKFGAPRKKRTATAPPYDVTSPVRVDIRPQRTEASAGQSCAQRLPHARRKIDGRLADALEQEVRGDLDGQRQRQR